MKYTIEIINWVWQESKPFGWFSHNGHPLLKSFSTQKAAREWLAANGFRPLFKRQKRPCVWQSPQGGMEARIIRGDDNPFRLLPPSGYSWPR